MLVDHPLSTFLPFWKPFGINSLVDFAQRNPEGTLWDLQATQIVTNFSRNSIY